MQSGFLKVCVVVFTAIVNHPLLFPRENATLPENDDDFLQKMKDHEENLIAQQLRLEEEMTKITEQKEAALDRDENSNEDSMTSTFWSVISMIIFLLIEIWRQDYQDEQSKVAILEEDDTAILGNMFEGVRLPNKAVLSSFYEQCIRGTANDAARTREFVEGFADDLLEALRSVCNRDADMEVEDSVGIGSMYENWRVNKPLLCDLIVPFSPPEPYRFQSQIWCSESSIPPDKQGYGKIKVCRPDEGGAGCICDKTKLGEDMLCLLHNKNNVAKINREMDDLLCCKNTQYLDTDQVMKWFQIAVTKAWNKISRKYDFELTFNHLDSPGALKIKFRSGKCIIFNISPVVQFEDSDAYFMSHFPANNLLNDSSSSVFWFLSFAVYERRFLKDIAKKLPENSCHLHCLQIVTFLHGKQCNLTGQSGLTNYHLKTVLMHLLLVLPPSDWDLENMEARLRDILKYLKKCLQEKKLNHFLIGNQKVPETTQLPEVFYYAEPLNLFRPFVLQRDLYKKTVDMFNEMLKNTTVLINEYTIHIPAEHTHILNKES